MSAIIAIVGRPNVGKSALFNRIVGRRIAIVHNEPGVTRDRISAEAEWQGRDFTLVDTGGIGLARGEKADNALTEASLTQAELAIASADVILMVVNLQEGLVPLDEEVARRLRLSGKPVLLAVNKADNSEMEWGASDYARLGFAQVFPVSAIHGRGIADLMRAAMGLLPPVPADTTSSAARPQFPPPAWPAGPLRIAIIGRPNVGKSSLTNALTKSERVIVAPIPGTTRDAVEVPFEIETDGVRQQYVLIDTAGVRKQRRVDTSIEFFSVKRAEEAITRSDLLLFLLDAEAGILEQDKKVGDLIVEAQKACIVVVNKWDLFGANLREAQQKGKKRVTAERHYDSAPKKLTTLAEFGQWVQKTLFFLDYAPVIFTSAKFGFHLDQLLEAVRYVAAQLKQKIPTSILNQALREAIELRQPVSQAGQRLKFFYATQVETTPPTFLLFVNRTDLFSPAYSKYLATGLRRAFGYEGCPIRLIPRARPRTIPPNRSRSIAARRRRQ